MIYLLIFIYAYAGFTGVAIGVIVAFVVEFIWAVVR